MAVVMFRTYRADCDLCGWRGPHRYDLIEDTQGGATHAEADLASHERRCPEINALDGLLRNSKEG